MKITGISEQQKNKDRLNIFIDGQFAFGLHIDVLATQGVKVNQEVTEEDIERIKTADAFRQAYDKSLNFLSRRPRSAQEIRHYLRDKLVYKHPDYPQLETSADKETFIANQQLMIEAILDRLTQAGYVNDAEFAKWWITNRQTFHPRGKRLLLLELKAKGISNSDIQTALTTPNEEGHFSSERTEYSELTGATEVATKYLKKHNDLTPIEAKHKLSRHLASKGFDWETINQVITNLELT